MPTITVNSITTGDAAPTAPPHRISDKATKSVAEVQFTAATGDGSPIGAYRITANGTGNRKTGELLANLGAVCGLDKCGASGVLLMSRTATGITSQIAYNRFAGPPADGSYPLAITALSETEGWG